MLSKRGVKRVFVVSQLFVKRNSEESIFLFEVTVAADFLVAGKNCDIDEFFNKMKIRFEVGMVNIGSACVFTGT